MSGLRRRPAAGLVLVALALFALPALASAQGMDTFAQGTELSWAECKSRAAAALREHGYGNQQDFSYGWLASARDTSVSVACVQTAPATEATLVITVSGRDPSTERARLVASILGARPSTAAPRAPSAGPPAPSAGGCAYMTGAPARPGEQAGVLVNYAQLPQVVDWIAVADPGGGHFPSMWFRPPRRPDGQYFLAGPLRAGRTYVLRAFNRDDQPLGECPFAVQ